MIFKNPLILALLPVVLIWFVWTRIRRGDASFIFPTDSGIAKLRWSFRAWISGKTAYLRLAVLMLLIIAMARPQYDDESTSRRNGIALVLAIDCSSTMLAEDLQLGPTGLARLVDDYASTKEDLTNRIDSVKDVAKEFVIAQPHNMIGVVAFAAYAYIVCPPTFDQKWIFSSIDRIRVGMIQDATAIGSGIMASVKSLSKISAKSKVIVLLTDGNNNFGNVPPLIAARTAASLGIKIYTIGIVTKGQALYPTVDREGGKTHEYVRIEIDEGLLRKIADITGGKYYSVKSLNDLDQSYGDIDRLEKSYLAQRQREDAKDLYPALLGWALALLIAELVVSNSYLRRIP